VRRLLNFTATLLYALSLADGVIECAGWQSSPAARMACCESGTCPMHRDETGAASVTQAQADSCCAVSGRHNGNRAPSSVFTPTLVVMTGPVAAIAVPRGRLSHFWQPESSHRPSSTPRHFLDSVLLV